MEEQVLNVAKFMELSANTAPKSLGENFLETKILSKERSKKLADQIEEYGEKTGKNNFKRDSKSVRKSEAVFLISLKDTEGLGLDCGACGEKTCSELRKKEGPEFKGPLCTWRIIDLGIAIGSAVKTASLFNVDNRVMYRIGVVARKKGIIKGEIVLGIPLAAGSKNIYFDR